MNVAGIGGVTGSHPFVDPRQLDGPKPAVGASAGTAFARPSISTAGTAFVSPTAVPPPKDLGRHVDVKL
jgi:hypothetical protein